MSIFFRPDKAVLGDVIPFYENGVFMPFYLRNYRANRDANHQDSWVMLRTKDHVHFEEHDTKIVGGTGSVIKEDGLYHMFYCTFRQYPERNYINHAVSTDLDKWTPLDEDTFCSDDVIYAPTHFRDPFVFWVEEEKCWWMIFAAQKKGPTSRRGCVGLCKSNDLHHWSFCEPLYAPMNAQCAFECPDLFKWGDWYYLVFSSYADRFQTLYRMSKSLNGPWITPPIDTFDTRAFYAAKTGTDGHRRFVYGWNPTRENDEHHFDPQEHNGLDCNTWDWGGNLIVHELWQDEDGYLYVKPVPEVQNAYAREIAPEITPLCGAWQTERDACQVASPYGYASLLLNAMPDRCRLSMDVEVQDDTNQLGVALHVDEAFAEGYYAIIDLYRKRIEYRTPVRMTERGGQKFPYEVEMERPLSEKMQKRFHVDIMTDGTILEIYVDGRIALGTRMYDKTAGNLGLFVAEGTVRFENIRLFGTQF